LGGGANRKGYRRGFGWQPKREKVQKKYKRLKYRPKGGTNNFLGEDLPARSDLNPVGGEVGGQIRDWEKRFRGDLRLVSEIGFRERGHF